MHLLCNKWNCVQLLDLAWFVIVNYHSLPCY
ncbi:hypothetical protein ECH_1145 [Ehrlichia chaffeensis str. Arkansas]|uniref:Uncharacterized protein n=1 Tax=Ehrlichia chaffeensis (strain ATCC CRL-10679 / Arkansas) TaxID=205920 RepID=Q2GF54_EHRCR|nr:hypothetical protein ECH_1145 [Ehrlichia chaffeensis str. Arkansas]